LLLSRYCQPKTEGYIFQSCEILSDVRRYGDTQLWADDIQAVITTLELDHPLLSAWSYGGEIMCDYLRHYGEEHIGGLNFIGAVSKLGEPVFLFLTPEDFYFFLGFNTIVPLYVRAGLFDRTVENDDILAKVRKPVLLTHGEKDALVLTDMAEYHKERISHAQISFYSNVGHTPFWKNPERFNSELRSFVQSL
jgi:non-heme chloroperoxidase